MIVELVKKSYKTIVNTPAITLYLVLFLIAINLLAPFIAYARIPVVGMILILCAFFFCSCFFAGWCQILKENTNKEIDKDKKYNSGYAIIVSKEQNKKTQKPKYNL